MMSLKDMPIRRKLIGIILLTCLVVMVLMRASFLTYEYLTFRQTTVRQLGTIGKVIAANSTAALAFANQNDAEDILSALKADQYVTAGALYDKSGKLFSKYPAHLPDTVLPAAPQKDGFQFQSTTLAGFQPVVQDGKRLGTLYLRYDTGTVMHEWLQASVGIAAAVMTVAILVAYLLSRKLQQQISRPILALAATAKDVSDHRDYSVRAEKFGEDESGLLTDAFNQMLMEIQAQDQAIKKLNAGLEQRVIERTSQLEAANKELEAFSYSISHDLRAPLRAMNGFAGIVLEDFGPQLPDEGRGYLERIRNGGQRMGELIDDLLSFSRLSRQPVRRQHMNSAQMVREALDELKPQQNGRQIEMRIGALPPCEADPVLLKQVWVNLLSNAIKYSRDRQPAVVEVGCTRENNMDVFFVRDNGAGFDMQYANKLFGVFQRLHRSDEFEGTGVGLAIVQRIVHRHGGRVWAEGQINRGATFYFTIKGETNP
jgi:signal transduction histidine kinase